jgi:hypothetical protein
MRLFQIDFSKEEKDSEIRCRERGKRLSGHLVGVPGFVNSVFWEKVKKRLQQVPVAFQSYPDQLAPRTHFCLAKQLLKGILDRALRNAHSSGYFLIC